MGLTKEHIKRLNNAINILESLNEHTDARYLKEIKDKLLEDAPEPKFVKVDGWVDEKPLRLAPDVVCNTETQPFAQIRNKCGDLRDDGICNFVLTRTGKTMRCENISCVRK